MTTLDRRSFLQLAAAALPLGGAWGRGVWAPRGDDRTLVVLELVGGNDGLNTVIPVDDARYATLRPKLQSVRGGSHRLADGTALHPALAQVHRAIGDGRATVLHGVGYAQPDRSHFRSRDIWHVADPTHQKVTAATTGWMGRAADLLAAASAGVPAAAVGGLEVPLALKAARTNVPSLRRMGDFQWLSPLGQGAIDARSPTRTQLAAKPANDGDLRSFVERTRRQAVELADSLALALARYTPRAEYPATTLATQLRLVAQLVIAGFGTRLLHVGFPGFDTHARQLPTHAGLLAQLDAALGAFVADVTAHGRGEAVAVLVHSEFGRRAAENASQGTDHGASAPAFVLMGGAVGGLVGAPPDLQRLDDGDPVATMDFRRIYADLLAWLGVDAVAVLGGAFATAGLWPASVIR